MLFFYIRHGDPVYEPDSLTALGEKQADALAKRLAAYGVDRIFSSSSNRAIQTAKPTCDLLKKEMEIVDFANEIHAWNELTVEKYGMKTWLFYCEETKMLMADESVTSLGHNWYEHEEFTPYKQGISRISNETASFFKSLGYEHIKESGKYKVIKPNNERIAFFAHQGFGIAFLSEILGIPYPFFANHFDISHTGMTVINFREVNGYAVPKVLTLSSDSHIYREGLPTKYNNEIYF
ncbi:MAG: histidine phosphatase family protein [Clostridia bacterium]|nr:histidine phosphatase family protein [Clostridia bacterium]